MTKADTENILSRRDRLALGTAISAVPTSLMPVRSVNSSLCRCLGYNSGAGYLSFGGCLPGEMGETRLCDSDDRAPKGVLPFYEAPVVGFFPNIPTIPTESPSSFNVKLKSDPWDRDIYEN